MSTRRQPVKARAATTEGRRGAARGGHRAVSDVDQAKAFYESLGWKLDMDVEPAEGVRIVQFTPPGSGCSISFGEGVTPAEPGFGGRSWLSVTSMPPART